jgi:hypothetical protein
VIDRPQHADATAPQICGTYQQLRDQGTPVHTALEAIVPWLRVNGARGLMDLLWQFAEDSSDYRSDFSRAPHARELLAAVLADAVLPGLAASLEGELAEWLRDVGALIDLNQDVSRGLRSGARRSAPRTRRAPHDPPSEGGPNGRAAGTLWSQGRPRA